MSDTWIKAYVTFEISVNLSFFLPAILAWRRWPRLPPPFRVLALLTVFIPVMFGFSRLAIALWKYNLAVGHATTFGEGLLYLWYFQRLFKNTKYKAIFPFLMVAFVAFGLIDSVYLEGFDRLNSYTNGVESFLCISFVFLYFEYYLLKGKLNSPIRNPAFITNCAILIYMTSTVGVYLFLNNFIAQNDADAVYRTYFINVVMLLFLSLTLARAFWLAGRATTPADRHWIS